jgi:hypothetical protein
MGLRWSANEMGREVAAHWIVSTGEAYLRREIGM